MPETCSWALTLWVVATFRYSAAILDWNKNEIDEMDRKTRKLLTIYGTFRHKSSVNRLYMKRKDDGRGLISPRDCTDSEIRNIEEYIANSEEDGHIHVDSYCTLLFHSKSWGGVTLCYYIS